MLPSINTNFSHHICAGLENGVLITGQNAISHPSEATEAVRRTSSSALHQRTLSTVGHASDVEGESDTLTSLDHADRIEDANLPGSLPVLRKPYISFTKTAPTTAPSATSSCTAVEGNEKSELTSDLLPVPIERLWYINPYGQEIRPYPNDEVLLSLRRSTSIVYSIGSLYTSLIPSLILRGVGDAIAFGSARQKILILNGSTDRETSSLARGPFTGMDFVKAITRACQESRGIFETAEALQTEEYKRFVTHVIYIEEEGAPVVEKRIFAEAGIELVRAYGRRMEDNNGWMYDGQALAQALEALVRKASTFGSASRRNTFVG